MNFSFDMFFSFDEDQLENFSTTKIISRYVFFILIYSIVCYEGHDDALHTNM
jgi:hypothetical protein